MPGTAFPTPGEILRKHFMEPRGITIYRLARDTRIPATRISGILRGRRKINPDTALRLSRYFGNAPEFWLGIQNRRDLEEARERLAVQLARIQSVP